MDNRVIWGAIAALATALAACAGGTSVHQRKPMRPAIASGSGSGSGVPNSYSEHGGTRVTPPVRASPSMDRLEYDPSDSQDSVGTGALEPLVIDAEELEVGEATPDSEDHGAFAPPQYEWDDPCYEQQ